MSQRLDIDHSLAFSSDDRAELISDLLQAEQAILWDRRGSGAQLRAYGVDRHELARRLIDLALDVRFHEQRGLEGRETAAVVDGHGLHALLVLIANGDGTTVIPEATVEALREAWREWKSR